MGVFGWVPENTDMYELEEGEWIPEEHHDIAKPSENVSDEGIATGLKLFIYRLISIYVLKIIMASLFCFFLMKHLLVGYL